MYGVRLQVVVTQYMDENNISYILTSTVVSYMHTYVLQVHTVCIYTHTPTVHTIQYIHVYMICSRK